MSEIPSIPRAEGVKATANRAAFHARKARRIIEISEYRSGLNIKRAPKAPLKAAA